MSANALGHGTYEHIKSHSVRPVTTTMKPGGIPKDSRITSLLTGAPQLEGKSHSYYGRAYEIRPESIPQNPLAFELTKIEGPEAFWEARGIKRKGEGYILTVSSRDEAGNLTDVQYHAIPDELVPREFGNAVEGIWAKLSCAIGKDRGSENIISAKVNGTDVKVTHCTPQADSKKKEINPDGWESLPDYHERKELIERLYNFPPHIIEKQEVRDGGKTLRIYLNHNAIFTDEAGKETEELFYRDIDITCLNLDASNICVDPNNRILNAQVLMPCFTQDFEALGERKKTLLFPASKTEENDHAVVDTYKDAEGKIHVQIKPKTSHQCGDEMAVSFTNDDEVRVLYIGNVNKDGIKTFTPQNEEEINQLPGLNENERSAAIIAFQKSKSFELTGASPKEIRQELAQLRAQQAHPILEEKAVRTDIMYTARCVKQMENVEVEPPEKVRPRFVLQYHETRTTSFPNLLEKMGIKLQPGQSINITKVKSAATVVHIDASNGKETGASEIIPLNVDASQGDYKNYGLVMYDRREYAQFKSGFIPHAIDTCIAGQNLVNPFGPSDEVMAAAWALADQLGFFGVFAQAAMKFPFGRQFMDPSKQPWFLKLFGSVFQSLFDAKSFAGQKVWPWTGLPVLKYMAEVTGAAMVTGPNTATPNPARDHLFVRRIPGVGRVVKTGIPGSYILVIEDAELSYFAQTWFGLKTVTTPWPLSCGGGVDNYQLVGVQRELRWNGGIALWLMDGGEEFAEDLLRGGNAYHKIYDLIRGGRTRIIPPIDGINALLEPTATAEAIKGTQKDMLPTPLPKKFKLGEAWQWLAVGTWYYVAFQVFVKYFSVPVMLLMLGILPIPVAGSIFLVSCLATTLFSWPFWAMQMAKVGINPRFIISLRPKHIFWSDLYTATMMKAGLDIERLAVGKFRASEKSTGNRMIVADKRMAFLLFGLLPTIAGATFILSAIGLTTAIGFGFVPLATISGIAGLGFLVPAAPLIPLALCALPIIAGILGGKGGRALVSRLLPNPNSRSLGRSALYWTAGLLPQLIGIGIAWFVVSPICTLLAFPLITAGMAGGWTLYMGINMLKALMHYHREMKEMPTRGPKQPRPIPKNKIDTWRRTFLDALWIEPPRFFPREFAKNRFYARKLWWFLGGQSLDESRLHTLPSYKDLKDFLIKNNVIPPNTRIPRSYDYISTFGAALQKEKLTDQDFRQKFGVSVDEVNDTLYACSQSGIFEGILKNPGKDALTNINACIEGEGDGDNAMLVDMALEARKCNYALPAITLSTFLNPFSLNSRLARKIRETAYIRDKIKGKYKNRFARTARQLGLGADDWAKIAECNRMVIEYLSPHCAPRRGFIF